MNITASEIKNEPYFSTLPDITLYVKGGPVDSYTFNNLMEDSTLQITDPMSNVVEPDDYTLYEEWPYTCTYSCPGYTTATGSFTVPTDAEDKDLSDLLPELVKASSKPAGGNSTNTSSGSSKHDDDSVTSTTKKEADSFWNTVISKIENAQSGSAVKVNAKDYATIPSGVMKALRENDTISLELVWDDGTTIIIPAGEALDDGRNSSYLRSYLKGIYAANDEPVKENTAGNTVANNNVNPGTGR